MEIGMEVDVLLDNVKRKNPGEHEFHQAVTEVVQHVAPFANRNPKYRKMAILERLVEPDRVVMFRVAWLDDNNLVQVNRGYRIQFNNAIGPYKGGLRFDGSVSLSILKFLAFEQIFKNSLTTLPMGGGKGGSDFSPKGKSDMEVMRFCQSFMTELARHIGANVDVPAGDIGVGAREVGYLFGQYKRLRNKFEGVLTGKGAEYGGSKIRPEATGYGAVYFAEEMLKRKNDGFEGKTATISGSGNVAQYAAEKLIQLGAKVLSLSDRQGTLYIPGGLTEEGLARVMQIKNEERAPLSVFCDSFEAEFREGQNPWSIGCDMAYPCATQNELDENDARILVENGCTLVSEGANMPSTPGAVEVFEGSKIMYAPGKAANAGGVAVSGLEMSQNSQRLSWDSDEVDRRLKKIMSDVHESCVEYGTENGHVNYVAGANIAGFVKVANAMLAYGVV